MSIALRNTTCKDLFDFDSQKDAMFNTCLAIMDPLLSTRRKRITLCDKPWDSKWINDRYEHIRLRHHATTKHVKENHVTELTNDNVHPSVKSNTKDKVMKNDGSKEEEMMNSLSSVSSSEVAFTSLFEAEVEDECQKQLELSYNESSSNGQADKDELNNECEDNISKADITGNDNNLIVNCNEERQEHHVPITMRQLEPKESSSSSSIASPTSEHYYYEVVSKKRLKTWNRRMMCLITS